MTRIKPTPGALAALIVGVGLLTAANYARGQGVDTSNPNLPPDTGEYLTPDLVHARYTNGDLVVVLNRPEHKPIADRAQRTNQGADEVELFPSTMQGDGTIVWPSHGIAMTPVTFSAQGPVNTVVHNKTGNVTGTFNTEMLSMSLFGNVGGVPFTIRESPSLQSLGQTKITAIGGGMFHIDSFFDVFTELDVTDPSNGQVITMPDAEGPVHVNLVPEPSSIVLGGLGLMGMGFMAFRRRRARERTI